MMDIIERSGVSHTALIITALTLAKLADTDYGDLRGEDWTYTDFINNASWQLKQEIVAHLAAAEVPA